VTRLAPLLEEVHERLAGVVIERLPYGELIRRYDRPETLFYLYPPYWAPRRTMAPISSRRRNGTGGGAALLGEHQGGGDHLFRQRTQRQPRANEGGTDLRSWLFAGTRPPEG
jgi:hypothetical protein